MHQDLCEEGEGDDEANHGCFVSALLRDLSTFFIAWIVVGTALRSDLGKAL